MFKIENVTFTYEENHPVFENLTIQSNQKKIGIIGDNGTGKTTILKLLSKDIFPKEGIISVDGETYLSRYEFQYYKNLTINDLLDLASTLQTFDMDQKNEIIQGLRIESYLNHQLKNLSQGTYKKVGLLLTFLSKAEIILVDEPFESIDQASCEFVKEYLINKQTCFVLVDHHIEEVKKIVEEIIDLNQLLNLETKG